MAAGEGPQRGLRGAEVAGKGGAIRAGALDRRDQQHPERHRPGQQCRVASRVRGELCAAQHPSRHIYHRRGRGAAMRVDPDRDLDLVTSTFSCDGACWHRLL